MINRKKIVFFVILEFEIDKWIIGGIEHTKDGDCQEDENITCPTHSRGQFVQLQLTF